VNFSIWTKLHRDGEVRVLKIGIRSATGCCNIMSEDVITSDIVIHDYYETKLFNMITLSLIAIFLKELTAIRLHSFKDLSPS
jgi:hypothetical protein